MIRGCSDIWLLFSYTAVVNAFAYIHPHLKQTPDRKKHFVFIPIQISLHRNETRRWLNSLKYQFLAFSNILIGQSKRLVGTLAAMPDVSDRLGIPFKVSLLYFCIDLDYSSQFPIICTSSSSFHHHDLFALNTM